MTDRTDYAKNPEKTNDGELISSYECAPKTADAEFLLAKRRYKTITGREQSNDVIAYQIRQSFKPGDGFTVTKLTAEEANKLGYELAMRFLKGKHAFIVCTHQDKSHVHSHIIFNSTTLDCKHKFRDFLGSGRAVARLSDMICQRHFNADEHKLSVIENPKRYTHGTYDKWLGNKAKPSHRELLRAAIDNALSQKPQSFDDFLKLMERAGYAIKRGAHVTFCLDGQKNIRLRSLGDGYAEDEIRAVISGEKQHTPKKKRSPTATKETSLLIDIQAKLDAGMGVGFQRWATVQNLKQMAQTVMYLQEHDLADYDELAKKSAYTTARFNALSEQIKSAETRMAEIAVLKTHIINYSKTREIYAEYRKAGYSKKFLSEHEGDIILHKAAKKAFDEMGMKKLPAVRSLQEEYSKLLTEKKAAYAEYRSVRDEMKELLIHKQNIEKILGIDNRDTEIQKENALQ